MSFDTLIWVRIVHIVGFILWVGGLLSVLALLRAHAEITGAGRDALTRVERGMAGIMDLGATLAIATGFYQAFASPNFPTNAFSSGGWLHVKLTLVVLVPFALHGFARRKIRTFRGGNVTPIPGWMIPLVVVAVAGIVVMGAHPTLLRKKPAVAAPAAPVETSAPGPTAP